MKMFGSWSRLVSILFRKDGRFITLQPNQNVSYSSDWVIQLPETDGACVLISSEEVSGAYLSKSDASSTYLTQSNAASTYLTQSDAASTYLNQSDAANTYLSQTDAALYYQPLDADLTAIAGLSSNGLVAKTGAGTMAAVSIDAGVAISVINGDGVLGNPEVHVDVDNAPALGMAPASGDELLIADVSDSNAVKKITVAELAEAVGPSAFGYAADWEAGEGSSKSFEHNLGSLDVMVQVIDKADYSTMYVDSVVRQTSNQVVLTASEAPSISGWRVLVQKIA